MCLSKSKRRKKKRNKDLRLTNCYWWRVCYRLVSCVTDSHIESSSGQQTMKKRDHQTCHTHSFILWYCHCVYRVSVTTNERAHEVRFLYVLSHLFIDVHIQISDFNRQTGWWTTIAHFDFLLKFVPFFVQMSTIRRHQKDVERETEVVPPMTQMYRLSRETNQYKPDRYQTVV